MSVKEFSEPPSKDGEIGRFNRYLLISKLDTPAQFSFTITIYCFIWIQDILSAVINTIKAQNKTSKALEQYTATNFQG